MSNTTTGQLLTGSFSSVSNYTVLDDLLVGQPIPLRMVPFITGWSMDELADFLTDRTMFTFELLIPHEWRGQDEPRRVSMETMGEILKGIKEESDRHDKLARFPKNFFVFTADLENAFYNTCNPELYAGYGGRCPFHLDWNPSVHSYEELIHACPDFSPAPSNRDLGKQAREARNKELIEKAKVLRARQPDKSENWIAKKIYAESKKIKPTSETIRKIIRIPKSNWKTGQ